MANNCIYYTCYIIILTACIGQGDGRWKKKDEENLRHDIEVFKEMSEKIEHELKSFYDDDYDENVKDSFNGMKYKDYIKKKNNFEHRRKIVKDSKTQLNSQFLYNDTNHNENVSGAKIYDNRIAEEKTAIDSVTFKSEINHSMKNNNVSKQKWPKFEEIILEMGKKYDWKNDRWIKVKNKFKQISDKYFNKGIEHNAKHKFSYRTVKLNRKSRRNVVIAVSAVR